MLDQISEKLLEGGQAERMSTWGVPFNMLMIDAGVTFAMKWLEGEVDRDDLEAYKATVQEVAMERNAGNLEISNYVDPDKGELENFFLFLAPFYDFSKAADD